MDYNYKGIQLWYNINDLHTLVKCSRLQPCSTHTMEMEVVDVQYLGCERLDSLLLYIHQWLYKSPRWMRPFFSFSLLNMYGIGTSISL